MKTLKPIEKLYNIEDDPNETNEISDDYPLVVNEMLAKLAEYYVWSSLYRNQFLINISRTNKQHRFTRKKISLLTQFYMEASGKHGFEYSEINSNQLPHILYRDIIIINHEIIIFT